MSGAANFLASAGLGALIGLLLGLSQTSLVGSLASALVAGLAAYLGLAKSDEHGAVTSGVSRDIKMAAFSLFCVAGIAFGLYARVNNLMLGSIGAEVARLREAGFDANDAHRLVAYRHYGLLPADQKVAEKSIWQTLLFSEREDAACRQLADRKTLPDQLEHMRRLGGVWEAMAAKLQALPPERQAKSVNQAIAETCGP